MNDKYLKHKLVAIAILLLIGCCDRFDSYEFEIEAGQQCIMTCPEDVHGQ